MSVKKNYIFEGKKFRVLIAHQSTIPHYRVAFYQEVQNLKPDWWDFEVIYDKKEANRHFYMESDTTVFNFKIKSSKSFNFDFLGRKLTFQFFPFTSWKYDLLIVGQAMNNISYPFSFIRKILGKPLAYWGQGRDLYLLNTGPLKRITESIKLFFTKLADGFFAYTVGVKSFLVQNGVDSEKIFPLQNTIDIEGQRSVYDNLYPHRQQMRKELKVDNKKVLLYVGRFNSEKRIDILADAFMKLAQMDDKYILFIVGGGNKDVFKKAIEKFGEDKIRLFGVVPENDIAKYFVVSDLFLMPGSVGLNVIQAMCYNLIPVVIDSQYQSPEYEYLDHNNAIILNKGATPSDYAIAVDKLFSDSSRKITLESSLWNSISNLTIENMALNFIRGVEQILLKKYSQFS